MFDDIEWQQSALPVAQGGLGLPSQYVYHCLPSQYVYNCLPSQYVYHCLPSQYVYHCLPSQYMYHCLPMHPLSVPLDILSVNFSKTFLNFARRLKLTHSLIIGLHRDTNLLRRTRSHSSGTCHQLSSRFYSVPSNPTLLSVFSSEL